MESTLTQEGYLDPMIGVLKSEWLCLFVFNKHCYPELIADGIIMYDNVEFLEFVSF